MSLIKSRYFEPWMALKSTAHGPRPNLEGFSPEVADLILDAWNRTDDKAGWNIWGTGILKPYEATSMISGEKIHMDGRGILFTIYNNYDNVSSKALAEIVVERVNALAGVRDPVHFVAHAYELMLERSRL